MVTARRRNPGRCKWRIPHHHPADRRTHHPGGNRGRQPSGLPSRCPDPPAMQRGTGATGVFYVTALPRLRNARVLVSIVVRRTPSFPPLCQQCETHASLIRSDADMADKHALIAYLPVGVLVVPVVASPPWPRPAMHEFRFLAGNLPLASNGVSSHLVLYVLLSILCASAFAAPWWQPAFQFHRHAASLSSATLRRRARRAERRGIIGWSRQADVLRWFSTASNRRVSCGTSEGPFDCARDCFLRRDNMYA